MPRQQCPRSTHPAEGLGDEEVHECHGDGVEGAVDVADLRAEAGLGVVEEVRQREGDEEGDDPEAGGADGHHARLLAARRELGGANPGERAPGEVEEEDYNRVSCGKADETRRNSPNRMI